MFNNVQHMQANDRIAARVPKTLKEKIHALCESSGLDESTILRIALDSITRLPVAKVLKSLKKITR
jgi:antitoxin component of RelBE/YafQ-DinJ toxin-antitoxin module